MADPVGIVGTAAGLVSLGFQVYGGIKDYLDAVQGREEELASINRHVAGLRDALSAVETGCQNRAVEMHTSAPSAMTCLQSCETDLKALDAVLAEAAFTPPTSGSGVLKSKLMEGKKKFAYPFKRSHIAKLEERLRDANLTLHTALQSLGLDLLTTIQGTLSDSRTQSSSIASGVVSIQSEIMSLTTSVQTANNTLPIIVDSVQGLAPLIETETRQVSARLLQDGQLVRQNVSHLGNQMESSFTSQKSHLERIEAHVSRGLENERLKRIEEILIGLQSTESPRRQHDSTNIYVGRLVAKQDNLKVLCDEFTVQQSLSESHSREVQSRRIEKSTILTRGRLRNACSCGVGSRRTRCYNRWGALNFYKENCSKAVRRFSDCECSPFAETESFIAIGATFLGSGSFLRRAIEFTFSMKHGAGGASISAGLVYYNVVDVKSAPVFRLIAIVMRDLDIIKRGDLTDAINIGKLLQACSTRIRQLYLNGKAAPTDLDLRGGSVLHHAAYLVSWIGRTCPHARSFEYLKSFIFDLLESGAPAGVCDHDGCTPLIEALTPIIFNNCQTHCTEIWELLFSRGSDIAVSSSNRVEVLEDPGFKVDYLQVASHLSSSLAAAEVLGCNCLSIAVLQRDISEVKRLLQADSSLSFERNAFGMTPFHVALQWPTGLKELLEETRGRGLPPPTERCPSLLYVAAKQSNAICNRRNVPGLCSDCACSATIELILRYDHSLWDEDIGNFLRDGSLSAKVILLERLRDRRVRLRDFAWTHLSKEDWISIGLGPMDIPDTKTNRIIDLLERRGFEIPEPLQTKHDGVYHSYSAESSSVYHYIDCPATADASLSLGFKDFGAENGDSRTPLSMADNPAYALWLIEHGADITSTTSHIMGSKLNQRPAHEVAHSLGWYLSGARSSFAWDKNPPHEVDVESRDRLLDLICNIDAPDSCECACSSRGCTPILAMIKGITRWFTGKYSQYVDVGVDMIMHHLSEVYDALPKKLSEDPEFSQALLRYLTFNNLGIRHTCCVDFKLRSMYSKEPYDQEDLEEIREEDQPLTEHLEELMEEFEIEYHSSDGTFRDFLEGYWEDRMEKALLEMRSKATEEQKRRLAEIGVNWVEYPDRPRFLTLESVPREQLDPDYWIRKMDEIIAP